MFFNTMNKTYFIGHDLSWLRILCLANIYCNFRTSEWNRLKTVLVLKSLLQSKG